MKVCEICGITSEETTVINSKKLGMVVCNKHRNQLYRHGKTFERTESDRNEIRLHNNRAEIVMISRKKEEVIAVIDVSDVDKVSHLKWRYANGYATTMIDRNPVTLHRLLINAEVVDHRDRDKLNNRRDNLREANKSKNSMNRDIPSNNKSGFIGVGFMKSKGKWRAYIKFNGKDKHLGTFNNIEDALKVRLQAEKEMFGEFAPQKHLFEKYNI